MIKRSPLHPLLNHRVSVLDYPPIQVFIFLFALFQLAVIIINDVHLGLLYLLYGLVLELAHMIDRLVGLVLHRVLV